MSPSSNPSTDLADVYVRLDFTWNTTGCSPRESSCGSYNSVARTIETSSLEHIVYNATVDHENQAITAGIVTTKEQFVEAELTAVEDEIRRGVMEHGNVPENDPGEADTLHISAVYLAQQCGNTHSKISRNTHPIVHCRVQGPGNPDTLTGVKLEKTLRKHPELKDKRIDVRETLSGFNMYIRDSTITRCEAKTIRSIIMSKEDVIRQQTRLTYCPPNSSNLPDPVNGTDQELLTK